MENFEFDVLEDDDELDVLELVLVGIPRKINVRKNYFDTCDDLNFYLISISIFTFFPCSNSLQFSSIILIYHTMITRVTADIAIIRI